MTDKMTNELEELELKYGPALAQYIWDEIEHAQTQDNVVSPDFAAANTDEEKYRQAA